VGDLGRDAFVRYAIVRGFDMLLDVSIRLYDVQSTHLRPQTFSAFSNTCSEKNP
jgi:hypothetical protein